MFKVGDFAKIGQVTPRALRLYDQMGLLKPINVDESTGYRYIPWSSFRTSSGSSL
jgi:DNA-binding transcriptional MerR regulator